MKRKKGLILSVLMAAVMLFSGCRQIGPFYFSTSLSDRYIAAAGNANFTVKECNILFMDTQNRYNAYYGQLGLQDFWNSETAGETFGNYLKEGRMKGEISALLLLNDMAADEKIVLSEEEKESCMQAAQAYYDMLSDSEKEFIRADESDVQSLYEKYFLAQKMIASLTEGAYLEISDNNKRVITIQLICMDDSDLASQVQASVASGADFLEAARANSSLNKIEYQISRGSLSPVLEEVAFYLEDAEVSEVIESEGKYFIIKCIDDFDEAMSMANEESVYRKTLYEQWYPYAQEHAEKCTVSFSAKLWDSMEFYEIYSLTSDNLFEIYDEYLVNNQ